MRKVLVAVVAKNSAVKVPTGMMLCDAMLDGLMKDIALTIKPYGQAPQHHARNLALADFKAGDWDDLCLIDDDVAAEPGALIRLIQHPVDMVCGAYPHRGNPGKPTFPIRWDASKPTLITYDGLLQIDGSGAGFLRISRAAIEKMVAHYGAERWYRSREAPDGRAWLLFNFELIDHELWSEDMSFFRLYREIGGAVWIDPEIHFAHIGDHAFEGHLGNWLRERKAQQRSLAETVIDWLRTRVARRAA